MNFFSKIRLFFSSLFQGLSTADNIIQGYSDETPRKTIGIHQVKDIHRVSPALLRGELTKEVAELRYRDYLVSEASRNLDNESKYTLNSFVARKYNFSALNHEIGLGLTDDVDGQPKYTLKIQYADSVKFLLEKYCDSFAVETDFDDNVFHITLKFNMVPNKNVVTSKAFCNYLQENCLNLGNSFMGDYQRLKSLEFVSYKITSVPNFIKFQYFNLVLTQFSIDDKRQEFVMGYSADCCKVENLLEKFVDDDLKGKYERKEKKNLPYNDEVIDLTSKCSICGKPMANPNEGKMNQGVCGKFCCTECLCQELLKKEIDKNK